MDLVKEFNKEADRLIDSQRRAQSSGKLYKTLSRLGLEDSLTWQVTRSNCDVKPYKLRIDYCPGLVLDYWF